jgi:ABC-2 type transport system permease protein
MAALVSAHLAGDGVRAWLREGLGAYLEGRTFRMLFSLPGAGLPVFGGLGYLGPLAALLLSFDAVNRERREGTLLQILAQPVYRDEVLLGKYLAGLFTLALLTLALLLLVVGLGLATAGLAPAPGEAPRLGLFWLLSVAYLGFWSGLGLLMSVLNRTALASALASAAAWIFLAFFVSLLAGGLADRLAPVSDPVRPARAEVAGRETLSRRLGLASPVNLYLEAAGFVLDPARRTPHQGRQQLDPAVSDRYTGRFTGPLELGQTAAQVSPHLAGLIAWAALAFTLAHLVFRRQEIRSGS